MKLQLSEEEIREALVRYVDGLMTLAKDTDMTIEFKAGRGENGLSAEVDIRYMGVKRINLTPDKPATTEVEKAPAVWPQVGTNPPESKPVETEQQKIDGRSKAARELKKAGGLFGTKPATPEAPEAPVMDKVDRAVHAFTAEPEAAKPERQEEAEEILSQGDEDAPEAEEAGEVEHDTPAAAEAPTEPPVKRRSLFN